MPETVPAVQLSTAGVTFAAGNWPELLPPVNAVTALYTVPITRCVAGSPAEFVYVVVPAEGNLYILTSAIV